MSLTDDQIHRLFADMVANRARKLLGTKRWDRHRHRAAQLLESDVAWVPNPDPEETARKIVRLIEDLERLEKPQSLKGSQ